MCVAQMFSNSILPYHGESSLRFIIPWEDGFPSDSAVSLDTLVLETVQSITILFRTVLEEKVKVYKSKTPLPVLTSSDNSDTDQDLHDDGNHHI